MLVLEACSELTFVAGAGVQWCGPWLEQYPECSGSSIHSVVTVHFLHSH